MLFGVRRLVLIPLAAEGFDDDLDDPYRGADIWTAKPGAPPFKSDALVSCD